ncbi:MAG: bifunctional diaminohydroxyphosphoribosylaminopyrimidine deaminase/5-amino-6-(5-phosphoribosylamino)uracil reductase RibD, partial [Planctomycetes bacterium]|nr:bifunctional diaminohydroxyphosphoribosylaminopyrimidine deaminase/5-amino-6-(5-phosphoribosylamino)uracil reductase RibD [Planctomycetota bacterium]
MLRAIELAQRGRGHVEPNPMVGCVIVRDGAIVSEGWHQRFGGPHAEIEALAAAGDGARGADVYVTLEPCCHQGKTGPCTQALIEAGVARVVVGCQDPNPQVAGSGLAELRAAGMSVETGTLAEQTAELVAPFAKLVTEGRPWVIAKWALTLDGKIASRTGDSQWISGEASRAVVHK